MVPQMFRRPPVFFRPGPGAEPGRQGITTWHQADLGGPPCAFAGPPAPRSGTRLYGNLTSGPQVAGEECRGLRPALWLSCTALRAPSLLTGRPCRRAPQPPADRAAGRAGTPHGAKPFERVDLVVFAAEVRRAAGHGDPGRTAPPACRAHFKVPSAVRMARTSTSSHPVRDAAGDREPGHGAADVIGPLLRARLRVGRVQDPSPPASTTLPRRRAPGACPAPATRCCRRSGAAPRPRR